MRPRHSPDSGCSRQPGNPPLSGLASLSALRGRGPIDPGIARSDSTVHRRSGRHELGRNIFHGKKGEVTRAYLDGTEDRLSALGLILNCVVLWNSVYLDRALAELRAEHYPVRRRTPPDCRRSSVNTSDWKPLQTPRLPEPGEGHRPLRDPDVPDEDDWARRRVSSDRVMRPPR
ncbi:Tn3 family transposase [Nocardia jinanensis]|uniref:Tn3 family transposase n=1 Tax=Nocardia jinanensis TaxID=382504 RepID=UPI0009EBAE54